MPLVKQGPVKNFDTDEELKLLGPTQRVTRSTIRRILKRYKIKCDPGITTEQGLNLMQIHNIPFDRVPPGPVTDVNGDVISKKKKKKTNGMELDFAADGYPKHIGKLKKMCKERNISFPQTAKRADLVKKLNDYMKSLK